MTDEELLALTAVQFNWAVSPEDVWSPLAFHVNSLHANVAAARLELDNTEIDRLAAASST